MNKTEVDLLNALNNFRINPKSVKESLLKVKRALERISPKSPAVKATDRFIETLHLYNPIQPLRYSEELSKAASEMLEARKKRDTGNQYLTGKECKKYVPENYDSPNCAIISIDEITNPEGILCRLLLNQEDREKVGLRFMISFIITQVGFAIDAESDKSFAIIIFSEDEKFPEDENFSIEGVDLSELKQAFDIFDVENKNRINIRDLVIALESQGKATSEPALYKIIKELDDGEKEFVTFPEFAKHVHERMSDKESKNGRKDIFKIFLPDANYESIDFAQLKDINNYLNLGFTEEQIKIMLEMSTKSKHGISFDDFIERMNIATKK